jgi:hypothetical protein
MKPIIKNIKRSEDLFIEFSEEELDILNLKQGDKLSWTEQGDGFLLQKLVPLEIDLSEFSRENLEYLISLSIERDIPINEVFINIINEFVENKSI